MTHVILEIKPILIAKVEQLLEFVHNWNVNITIPIFQSDFYPSCTRAFDHFLNAFDHCLEIWIRFMHSVCDNQLSHIFKFACLSRAFFVEELTFNNTLGKLIMQTCA